MKVNYHSHTKICNHATSYVDKIIEDAISKGFKVWGFSEHIPYKFNVEDRRTSLADFMKLLDDIKVAKEKYKGKINILCGVECEATISEKPWYDELRNDDRIDYMIFGNHYDSDGVIDDWVKKFDWETEKFYYGLSNCDRHLDAYCNDLVRGLEWEIFDYLAHPDVFMKDYPEWDKKCEDISHIICKTASLLKVPLGFNINGINMGEREIHGKSRLVYPVKEFWEIAKQYNCDVILELDSHNSEIFTDGSIEKAKQMLEEWNITPIAELKLK